MAINIRINDEWKLTSDAFNVILNRRHLVDPTKAPNWKKRKDEGASPDLREEWKEVGYYPSIELALDAAVDKTALFSEATSLTDLRKEMRQIRRDINGLLAE